MRDVSPCFIVALMLACTPAMSAGARPAADLALCTRSATVLACSDALGNHYSVTTAGQTTWLRGYEVLDKRRWVQTNSRYDQLTFFTGLASDGEAWIGTIQRVGWTTITRVSSSNGTRSKITCSRLNGCR
ncbi:glutamine synthetase [Pseudomonas triticifolii]|uniref:Glutamine synthetase n=1 Tax=Pseudomonas triticifolii TaxID=2762592 RepID=A0ABR7BFD8_9PSED|nr:glutamine synthetase [Pseudomonas triticifolii]MBC3955882.1 glutamine synthetase [Pseudomonas triticifolii]